MERLVQDGLITPEEAAVHPQRNVLTAALGVESAVADFSETPLPLEPGDILLISTDGLHGLVTRRGIAGQLPPRQLTGRRLPGAGAAGEGARRF